MARRCAPAHPAAQLVQLREPEALGVLDEHHRRIGHVDPDLDDRGRHEDLDLVVAERAHRALARLGGHAAVHQADAELRERLLEPLRHRGGGFEIGLLRFLDHGIHDVGLMTGRRLAAQKFVDLGARRFRPQRRLDRRATGRPLVQLRDVQVSIQA